ncbi:M23 family metallopeptidase [Trueperella bialowiezensis]|uniref:Glycyl-glycine endopeptidase lytM n=1 Tax=Trueperella bialowiezensis TaxID=312285 RepID=A0A3S4WH27_9ACTO|nr:M23 family metallopeptidase [Trueperella bialowiezensis]VEI13746.1 Glycyl-glycine endopeptidase lytM precursor [Trueperella bialowiezensis]
MKGEAGLNHDESKTLPSRKELRLAREAAEKEAATHVERVDQERDDVVATATFDTAGYARGPMKKVKPRTPKFLLTRPRNGLANRRGVLIGAGLAAMVTVGSAVSALSFSGPHDALAAHGVVDDGTQPNVQPAVPESLKKTNSAADAARYNGFKRGFAGTNVVQCDVRRAPNSLVSAFVEGEEYVVMPMAANTYRITSPFGWRLDPFSYTPSIHLGVDMAAPTGTPIYAMADGTVVHAGEGIDGRSNNVIVIEHEINGEKYMSWYVHMYDDGVFVKTGDVVKAGQHIGAVGSNGRSTGPHLHFEIHTGHELVLEDGSIDNIIDPMDKLNELGAIDVSDLC